MSTKPPSLANCKPHTMCIAKSIEWSVEMAGEFLKFLFTLFALCVMLAIWVQTPSREYHPAQKEREPTAAELRTAERKAVFMEDCMSVTVNTEKYCENTFKYLNKE